MRKIYLDYAATTPAHPIVVKTMSSYWTKEFGNASSLHSYGQAAFKAIDHSRHIVAKFLNCDLEEVIFTSGATEANNLAIKGTIEAWQQEHPHKTPHLLVSPIEHHCVLDSVKHLNKQGIEVTWLTVDKDGLVDLEKLTAFIQRNTVLISVVYGNNEVGTIEPIKDIGSRLKDYRIKTKSQYPLLHTDAVQAIQYLDCNVQIIGVDLLSSSAHKFYGPKGAGFLFIKKGTKVIRQQDGGSQEFNLRAGTANTAGIVGLGKALELASQNKEKEKARLTSLRDYLIQGLLNNIPQAQLTGHPSRRLPHIVSVVIPGAEGEAMLLHLDDRGIAASSGSACTSGSLDPSHVLLAMGIKPEIAHGSLRFSLGKYTTKKDLDYLLKVLPAIVKKLRKMAPKLE
jgi:cysteine desulfurase